MELKSVAVVGLGLIGGSMARAVHSRTGCSVYGTDADERVVEAAISEGGAYSVDSVATRIFDLASAIAGGDPEKLKKMQDAVEEGFKQAGLTWKDATGQDDMPQITKDTHAEITKRFDDLYAKLTGKADTGAE